MLAYVQNFRFPILLDFSIIYKLYILKNKMLQLRQFEFDFKIYVNT